MAMCIFLVYFFQLGIAKHFIWWRHCTVYTKRLTGPGAQVMVFATFAAKRAPPVARCKNAISLAGGASYDGVRGLA
jgi:hypothetical protein